MQAYLGGYFYKGALTGLKHGRMDMDMLVSLGSTTAFLYSLIGLFAFPADHLYFGAAAEIAAEAQGPQHGFVFCFNGFHGKVTPLVKSVPKSTPKGF